MIYRNCLPAQGHCAARTGRAGRRKRRQRQKRQLRGQPL